VKGKRFGYSGLIAASTVHLLGTAFVLFLDGSAIESAMDLPSIVTDGLFSLAVPLLLADLGILVFVLLKLVLS